jgi:hypothetical protein
MLLATYSIGSGVVCVVIVAIHSHFAFCGRCGRWLILSILILPLVAISFEYHFSLKSEISVWCTVVAWTIATVILMAKAPVSPPFLSILAVTTGIICTILSLGRLTWLIPFSSDLLTRLPLLGRVVDIRRLIGVLVGGVFVCFAFVRALRQSFPNVPVIPFPARWVVPAAWPKIIQSIFVPLTPVYNWIIRISVRVLNVIWVTLAILGLVVFRVLKEMFKEILEVWAKGATLRYTLCVGVAFASALLLVFVTVLKIPQEAFDYLTAPTDIPAPVSLVCWMLLGMVSVIGILVVWHRPGAGHVYHTMSALTALCVQLVVASWIIQAVVRISGFRKPTEFTWILTGPGPLLTGGTVFIGLVFVVFYFGHFKQYSEAKLGPLSDDSEADQR